MTDKERALEIIAGCSNLFDIEHRIIPRLVVVLDAVRKEARAAAFRDAEDALQSPTPGTMASTHFHQGFEQMRRLGILAISRAAANTEEGEGDG